MIMRIIYFMLIFMISLTSAAFACTPQPHLLFPTVLIVFLGFLGVLYYRTLETDRIVYFVIILFFVVLTGPAIPAFMFITLPLGIMIFYSAVSEDRITVKKLGPKGYKKVDNLGCALQVLILFSLIFHILIIPVILMVIYILCVKKKKIPLEAPKEDDIIITDDEGRFVVSNEAPGKQKVAVAIIFVISLLTAPLYAVHIGTSVKSIILFFSLIMLTLGLLLVRSIIRRAGIPKKEWISRVAISGILFISVSLITLNIKTNTFFGASFSNFFSVLGVKKIQFIIVFLLLLLAPCLFFIEEYMVKRNLSKA